MADEAHSFASCVPRLTMNALLSLLAFAALCVSTSAKCGIPGGRCSMDPNSRQLDVR